MTFAGPTAAAVIQLLHTQQHHVSLVILSRAHAHPTPDLDFPPSYFLWPIKGLMWMMSDHWSSASFRPLPGPRYLADSWKEEILWSVPPSRPKCIKRMNLFTSSSSAPAAAVQGKKIWEQTGWSRQQQPSRGKLKNLLPHWRNFSTLL